MGVISLTEIGFELAEIGKLKFTRFSPRIRKVREFTRFSTRIREVREFT